ncbi:hypothetical protein K437DRAFT_102910 [Tilletiaria anomala UBC 951]|uniref:Uncharacterized protein n=1 Tax=Tilletiaria anomala (strain ATCC 24038 / CBS 436.72 / UBC 951) TaxID=1037660 RepID=A0A066VZ46_TILAU|nr:uncharacterized protein K437DRAFT_102910 [Tilletiaria anomala UBC 951]KDN46997.1 hypothetical protein K437DRAFT_102910 [Tilletiaria anomala UBC 951]
MRSQESSLPKRWTFAHWDSLWSTLRPRSKWYGLLCLIKSCTSQTWCSSDERVCVSCMHGNFTGRVWQSWPTRHPTPPGCHCPRPSTIHCPETRFKADMAALGAALARRRFTRCSVCENGTEDNPFRCLHLIHQHDEPTRPSVPSCKRRTTCMPFTPFVDPGSHFLHRLPLNGTRGGILHSSRCRVNVLPCISRAHESATADSKSPSVTQPSRARSPSSGKGADESHSSLSFSRTRSPTIHAVALPGPRHFDNGGKPHESIVEPGERSKDPMGASTHRHAIV